MKWLCGKKITHGYFFCMKKGCRIKQQPESVKNFPKEQDVKDAHCI